MSCRLSAICRLLTCILLVSAINTQIAAAADHPGNAFVEGEEVRVTVPAAWTAWRAVDVDGKEIARGTGNGPIELGQLPIGYFEIRQADGPARITAAVVAKNAPADDTPIALDAGMSWFYAESQQL